MVSVPKPKIVFGRNIDGRFRVLKVRSWSGYMPGDYVTREDVEELLDSQAVRMGTLEVEVLGHWEDTPREIRRHG